MEGFIDPIVVNQFNQALRLATNATLLRRESGSSSMDRRRDLNDECGFPRDGDITPQRIRDLYDRDALAARVVEIWPKECWKVYPDIYETEDNDIDTPFEIAWRDIGRSLVGEPGYSKQTNNNALLDYCKRADIACGIGRYGGILLGLSDISTAYGFEQPVKMVDGSVPSQEGQTGSPDEPTANAQLKLNFVRVFDETQCQITSRETNRNSPRYGHPLTYQITFDRAEDVTGLGAGDTTITLMNVHWTRVIHIVDNENSSNEVIGVYRCRPVLNDLLTAQKPRWGSGEIYWKNAQLKLSFETHPQLGGDVMINTTSMKTQIEKALNGLQQWWSLVGMTAKPIAPASIDPKPYVDTAIQSICIKIEVPVPVFIGYEVGENAGTMNVDDWDARVMGRRQGHCTSRIIEPLLNRLINIGVLPVPTQGYTIEWPEVVRQNPIDKANVAKTKTDALAAFVQSGLEKYWPFKDYIVSMLDMSEEEADQIIKSAMEQQTGKPLTESPLLGMVGGISGVVELMTLRQSDGIDDAQLKQLLMLFYKIDDVKASAIVTRLTPPVTPVAPAPTNPSIPVPKPATDSKVRVAATDLTPDSSNDTINPTQVQKPEFPKL